MSIESYSHYRKENSVSVDFHAIFQPSSKRFSVMHSCVIRFANFVTVSLSMIIISQPIARLSQIHQSQSISNDSSFRTDEPRNEQKRKCTLSSYSRQFNPSQMSSTTKKFREFMAEPIGDKGIRDVPGIGDVLGAKLSEAGYEKVR